MPMHLFELPTGEWVKPALVGTVGLEADNRCLLVTTYPGGPEFFLVFDRIDASREWMRHFGRMCAGLPDYRLVDAQAQNQSTPGTFPVPGNTDLDLIRPGTRVKVCAEFEPDGGPGGERFWVTVTDVSEGDLFQGNVDHDLDYTRQHGLSRGDTFHFERRHVFEVLGGEDAP